jgi:hypothetical protein
VTVDVVPAGICKYELQNVVAGAPNPLRTESAPVITAQLTARSSMAAATAPLENSENSARSELGKANGLILKYRASNEIICRGVEALKEDAANWAETVVDIMPKLHLS